MNAPAPEPTDEIDRGRSYLMRGLIAVFAVYAITIATTASVGAYPATGRAVFKLAVIGGSGALALGLRWNWARWLFIAALLLFSLEWIVFALARDWFGMVAAPTHLACAVAAASRPARLYVQNRRASEGDTNAVP